MINMQPIGIWPTLMFNNVLPEHDKIYQEFLPFMQDMNNFDPTWQFGNCLSSIKNSNNDSMPWNVFFNNIQHYVDDFLKSLEPYESYSLVCNDYWANIYEKGNYQESHDHAFAGISLSAIYILDVDEQQEGGDLVFECPMYNLVKYSNLHIFRQWDNQHYVPKLEPGLLIIFPSWISHYVTPLLSDTTRKTLAANFEIKKIG